ncbi:hypothetical protein VNO77_21884 [Canavalia gladiata]|uniref:Uncharacterized protein n=1 Tax=Canavalia gladiata TaxID=3824 RepID=A0AAN9L4U0_CANGL
MHGSKPTRISKSLLNRGEVVNYEDEDGTYFELDEEIAEVSELLEEGRTKARADVVEESGKEEEGGGDGDQEI